MQALTFEELKLGSQNISIFVEKTDILNFIDVAANSILALSTENNETILKDFFYLINRILDFPQEFIYQSHIETNSSAK